MPGPITPLVNLPSINDPANLAAKGDNLINVQFPQMVSEINTFSATLSLVSTTDTSSTSNSIATGSKTFTVTAGKSFAAGMYLVIADTAAPSTNSMYGQVTSYSGTSLVMNIISVLGSGTKTAWTISQSAAGGSPPSSPFIQNFRLTLTTGLPVTTADVTGATTIYCTPYDGKSIALYDGSTRWNERNSAEFSLTLGTLTANKAYDVFCYDNAGVPALEFVGWSNDTTRATALVYQDGVLVKSGATTRRYMGTFYTTSTTTTEDSAAKRFLWNYYHRALRPLRKVDATSAWNYTTATPRQANNSTANQVDMLIGVQEDAVNLSLDVAFVNSGGSVNASTGIGLDGISTFIGQGGKAATSTSIGSVHTSYVGFVGLGRHYAVWVESSAAAGTTTWYGTNTSSGIDIISGLSGHILG